MPFSLQENDMAKLCGLLKDYKHLLTQPKSIKMKIQFKIYSFLVLSLLFFGWKFNASNQEKLFITIPKESVKLDAIQNERMVKIQRGEFFKNSVFVRTGDLRNIQREGSITVDIPILGTSKTFSVTYVDNHDKGGYSWSGSSNTNGIEDAKLNIHYMTQKVFGTLETEDRYFRLIDLSSNLWAFAEIDEEKGDAADNNVTCGNISLKPSKSIEKAMAGISGNMGVCDVDVLILYTEEAKNKEPDMTQLANNCILEFNEVLSNSAVNSCDLRFSLIGMQEIDFEEGFDLFDDLYQAIMGYESRDAALQNNPLPNVTEANSLRDQFNADIVIVFTGERYNDGNRQYGLAGEAATVNNPSMAFAIVDVCYALGKRKTFVHETGHIFDLWHENETDEIGRGYEFQAGGLFDNKKRRTIMHQIKKRKKRISHFSNPEVEYEGESTGSDTPGNEINSVQILRDNGCVVANYREIPAPSMSVGISYQPNSSPYVIPGGTKNYIANIMYGQPPYQYEWQISNDGFNFGNVLSTNNQLSQNYTGYQHGDELFIRLKVIDSTGSEDDGIFVQLVYENGGPE